MPFPDKTHQDQAVEWAARWVYLVGSIGIVLGALGLCWVIVWKVKQTRRCTLTKTPHNFPRSIVCPEKNSVRARAVRIEEARAESVVKMMWGTPRFATRGGFATRGTCSLRRHTAAHGWAANLPRGMGQWLVCRTNMFVAVEWSGNCNCCSTANCSEQFVVEEQFSLINLAKLRLVAITVGPREPGEATNLLQIQHLTQVVREP
jgi:hypothetical protein